MYYPCSENKGADQSFAVTAKLISVLVFADAKGRFSHGAAHFAVNALMLFRPYIMETFLCNIRRLNDKFQIKISIFFLFFSRTHNLCFRAKTRNNRAKIRKKQCIPKSRVFPSFNI